MNIHSISIEEMRESDASEACTLWYSIPELGIARSFDTPARIKMYLSRNPGFSSVARSDGRIVGALLCGHDGRRGSLYHLGVLPEVRRQGIARRMVQRSLARLLEAGLTSAFCFTWAKEQHAQAFWQKVGFKYSPTVQYRYHDIDGGDFATQ